MKDRTGIVILVLGIALILLGVGSCAGASRSQNDIGWSLGGMLLIVVGGLTAIIGLMVMGLSRR